MAGVPIAAGYQGLPTGSAFPIIYSKMALIAFRKATVADDVTNQEYSGEIAAVGNTVTIRMEPDVNVSPYQVGSDIEAQTLYDQAQTLVIDQSNYYAFTVDDIQAKQSDINWMALAADRGGYQLRRVYDANVLQAIVDQATNVLGSTAAPVVVRVNNGAGEYSPLSLLNYFKREMNINNVPQSDRHFVGDSIFWQQMEDEDSKLIPVYVTGEDESPLLNGRIVEGRIRGFVPHESNNLPNSNPTTLLGPAGRGANNWGVLIAIHESAMTTASQITKQQTYVNPDGFNDITRALHVFGRKEIRTEATFVAYYNTAGNGS